MEVHSTRPTWLYLRPKFTLVALCLLRFQRQPLRQSLLFFVFKRFPAEAECEINSFIDSFRSSGAAKGAPRLASSSQNSLSTHSDHSGVRSTPSPTRRISCPLHNSATSSRVTTPIGNAMKQRKPSFLLALHVRDQGNCSFESAVTFPQEGHYEVHVTMGEQHVTGSPLKVDVSRPLARKSLDCKFMRTDSCRNSTSSRRSTSSCKQSERLSPSPAKPPPPTEDDLIGRIGCRGRAKGEFTNPQVRTPAAHFLSFPLPQVT